MAMSQGLCRAPIFCFRNVDDAATFSQRLPQLGDRLRKDAERTSPYARLVRLEPSIAGQSVLVKFEYECG